MFKTLKSSFQTDSTRPDLARGFLRWVGGAVIAALGFQAIYSLVWVLE